MNLSLYFIESLCQITIGNRFIYYSFLLFNKFIDSLLVIHFELDVY
jgi:hypothetical protein